MVENGFGFSLDFPSGGLFALPEEKPVLGDPDEEVSGKRAHRRKTACLELSQHFEYRRAFSEVRLLEAMQHVSLRTGVTYNFITAGDVDSLSYLKVVLNQHRLDHVLCSTWCMAAEDILQIQQWWEEGRIAKFDMYLGEIFPGSYKIEWEMVRSFCREHPDVGRAAIFRNHSKIYAGCNEEEGFYFGIQTSANINTNPRTENGSITVDRQIYEFYKAYFDGIVSFEKD